MGFLAREGGRGGRGSLRGREDLLFDSLLLGVAVFLFRFLSCITDVGCPKVVCTAHG